MCVIAIVDDDARRPTPADIRAMWDANHYGGGVAWRTEHAQDKLPDGSPVMTVHWEKGLSLEDMLDRIPRLPVPFVAHFRVPSVGSACPELCHPFPIQHGAPLWLAGDGPASVLFHNGTWNKWDTTGMLLLVRSKTKIPPPPYSDSRAMALLTHVFGPHILDIIDEKVVIFSAYEEPETFGGPWYDRHGYTVSNTYWIGRISKEEKKETGPEKEAASKAVDTTYTVPPASMLPGIRTGGSPIDVKAEKKESIDELRARHKRYLEGVRGHSAAAPFPDWTKWTTDCPSWIIEAEFRLLTKRQLAKHEKSSPHYLSKNEWKRARNRKSQLLFAIARREIRQAVALERASSTDTKVVSPSSVKTDSGACQTALVRQSTSKVVSTSVASRDMLDEAARTLRDPRLEVATMTIH